MTTQSDTPGEGLAATDEQIEAGARALYKAFTGNNPDWEYGVDARGYRQEPYVSTVPGWKWHWAEHARIVTEAIATLRSPSVASDTAALPSGYEGMGVLKQLHATLDAIDHHIQEHSFSLALGLVSQGRHSIREAIAALGRVRPGALPQPDRNRTGKEPCGECYINEGETCDICGVSRATPPAPQPALALIEELTAALEQQHRWHLNSGTIGLPDDEGGWIEIDNAAEYSDSTMHNVTVAALASAKRFKGE